MKRKRISSDDNKDFTGLFEPVNLHERLILGLVCLAAICGLAILLNAYTQPSSAESGGESKRPTVSIQRVHGADAGPTEVASIDPMHTSENTAETAEVTIQDSSSAAATITAQSSVQDSVVQDNTARSPVSAGGAVRSAVDGATQQTAEVVHTVQSVLNPLGLLR